MSTSPKEPKPLAHKGTLGTGAGPVATEEMLNWEFAIDPALEGPMEVIEVEVVDVDHEAPLP